LGAEEVSEHSPQISNVRFGLEFEGAAVGQVLGKLARAALAQSGDCDALLLLHDELVLFGRRLRLEALPGQSPPEEINENVAD